jgi:hypothetical protein
MKKHYLVDETTYYYDGHGDCDPGATVLSVEFTDRFNELDPEKEYDVDLQEIDEDSDMRAEDGYNCTQTVLNFREIDEAEAIRLKSIIEEYSKISV